MPEQVDDASVTCTCPDPVPVERATRKGAAQTECLRCGRPIRMLPPNQRSSRATELEPRSRSAIEPATIA